MKLLFKAFLVTRIRSARKSGTLFEMSASGSGTHKKLESASAIGTLFFADERERE